MGVFNDVANIGLHSAAWGDDINEPHSSITSHTASRLCLILYFRWQTNSEYMSRCRAKLIRWNLCSLMYSLTNLLRCGEKKSLPNSFLRADKTYLSHITTYFEGLALWLALASCAICPGSVTEWVRSRMSRAESESRHPWRTALYYSSSGVAYEGQAWLRFKLTGAAVAHGLFKE